MEYCREPSAIEGIPQGSGRIGVNEFERNGPGLSLVETGITEMF